MKTRVERPSDVPSETWDKFLAYHAENPAVWLEFEKLALMAIERGVKKWGAKGIFEVVRWKSEIEDRVEFKANNNFASYYARVFELKHPAHAGFFEKRTINGLKEAA